MTRGMWCKVGLRRSCTLLLLAVFLAAQTVSLAHEVGHDQGGHDDACLTCNISKYADVALAPATPPLPVLVAAVPLPQAAFDLSPASDGLTKSIRAPPSFLIS